MSQQRTARLTHVGVYAQNIEAMLAFYTQIMGLQISDQDPDLGLYFLSAEPEEEHHQVVIAAGRTAARDAVLINQISFRCDELPLLISYYRRFKSNGVRIQAVLSHGNSFSIYAFDPEDNRIEIYWRTGLQARQPFGVRIDLEQRIETILEQNQALVSKHGRTGYANLSLTLPAADLP